MSEREPLYCLFHGSYIIHGFPDTDGAALGEAQIREAAVGLSCPGTGSLLLQLCLGLGVCLQKRLMEVTEQEPQSPTEEPVPEVGGEGEGELPGSGTPTPRDMMESPVKEPVVLHLYPTTEYGDQYG